MGAETWSRVGGGGARRAPLLRPSRAPGPGAPRLRVPVPTPPSRASPAAAPAHARGLAQGGERRRPRASSPEPVRRGEPAWSCWRLRHEDGPGPPLPGAELCEPAPPSRPGVGR